MGVIDQPIKETPMENVPEKIEASIGMTQEEVDLIPLKHYFGIDATDWSQDKYLSGMIDWARDKGLKDRSDFLTEVKKIELKLGSPSMGEKQASRIYHYLQLDRQLNGIIKEMEAYGKHTA